MSSTFVIGGGWSVTEAGMSPRCTAARLTAYGTTIGVNDAMHYMPVYIGLTMDRLWFENRYPILVPYPQTIYVREKCDCNVVPPPGVPRPWTTFKHFNKDTPSLEPGVLHGGNSGTCAVNLALQHSVAGDSIYLLGFDMRPGPKGEPYWYPPYPWTKPEGATKPGHFSKWVNDMRGFAAYAAMHDIRVVNVSSRSRLDCFPVMSYAELWRYFA